MNATNQQFLVKFFNSIDLDYMTPEEGITTTKDLANCLIDLFTANKEDLAKDGFTAENTMPLINEEALALCHEMALAYLDSLDDDVESDFSYEFSREQMAYQRGY